MLENLLPALLAEGTEAQTTPAKEPVSVWRVITNFRLAGCKGREDSKINAARRCSTQSTSATRSHCLLHRALGGDNTMQRVSAGATVEKSANFETCRLVELLAIDAMPLHLFPQSLSADSHSRCRFANRSGTRFDDRHEVRAFRPIQVAAK